MKRRRCLKRLAARNFDGKSGGLLSSLDRLDGSVQLQMQHVRVMYWTVGKRGDAQRRSLLVTIPGGKDAVVGVVRHFGGGSRDRGSRWLGRRRRPDRPRRPRGRRRGGGRVARGSA